MKVKIANRLFLCLPISQNENCIESNAIFVLDREVGASPS